MVLFLWSCAVPRYSQLPPSLHEMKELRMEDVGDGLGHDEKVRDVDPEPFIFEEDFFTIFT